MQPLKTLAVVSLLFASTAFADETLVITAGQLKTLQFKGLSRIAVGDPEVADVKTIGNGELVIVASKAGATTLLVWSDGAKDPKMFKLQVTPQGAGLAPPSPGEATPKPTFTTKLKVGQRLARPAPKLQRLAVGDPGICDLETKGDQVTLVGAGPGATTVLAWFEDGRREQWQVEVTK